MMNGFWMRAYDRVSGFRGLLPMWGPFMAPTSLSLMATGKEMFSDNSHTSNGLEIHCALVHRGLWDAFC